MSVKAIITTLDNLPILREQVPILQADSFVDEIIVVNNGSNDGTREWLDGQPDVATIHRENRGAGPGRNAGLDAAEPYDYVLMLDGGIRPLRDGTERMLDYLERTPEADVIGVEIPDFETDYNKAWRRWPSPVKDTDTYQNLRLSHTAYCLARFRAFDGLRFCEEGPFGQPGWGADDDEMAYQWREAGVTVHVVVGIHPYRRGSGSFRRLWKETGIWPNQYGSVYEQRVVWLQQNWPQYQPGVMWGEPPPERIITVNVDGQNVEDAAREIKAVHDRMRQARFDPPYEYAWKPYHVIVQCTADNAEFLEWAEPRRLRQHHGDTIVLDGEIVKRTAENRDTWTGDFILEVN